MDICFRNCEELEEWGKFWPGTWRAQSCEMVMDAKLLLLLLLLPFLVLGELGHHVLASIANTHGPSPISVCHSLSFFALGVFACEFASDFCVYCVEVVSGCKDETLWCERAKPANVEPVQASEFDLCIYFIISTMCTQFWSISMGPLWYLNVTLGEVCCWEIEFGAFLLPSASHESNSEIRF